METRIELDLMFEGAEPEPPEKPAANGGNGLLPSSTCRVCYRRLKNPKAVAMGMGKKCARKARARGVGGQLFTTDLEVSGRGE